MKLLVLLFVTFACNRISNGYRILGIAPLNTKSHWYTAEQVMKGLAKRGHQVDVVNHFPQKIPIPNYTDISLEESFPHATNNVSAINVRSYSSYFKKRLVDRSGTQICELLKHPKLQDLIKNPPQNPPYDVIVVEV